MHKTINSTELRKMIYTGAKMLEINRAKVDALNVFPVPDGDTGTNMSLTMQSCVRELTACTSSSFTEGRARELRRYPFPNPAWALFRPSLLWRRRGRKDLRKGV